MDEEERCQRLIRGLRDGDRKAAREFCALYGDALLRIAAKHLPRKLRRRVGPEDVVQSAFRTFLRRVQGGEFHLGGSDGLWQLVCAITLTKVREQARFHSRKRRGLNREVEPASGIPSSGLAGGHEAPGPSPAEAAAFADQFEQILASLDEEECQLVDLKLQRCTQREIAERLGCSERTVLRILKRVQTRLAEMLPDR